MKIENWVITTGDRNILFCDEMIASKKNNCSSLFQSIYDDWLNYNIQLIGSVYKFDGSKMKSEIVAVRNILKTDNEKVYCLDGSIYEIGKINNDYKMFLMAINNNVGIVNNWHIEKGLYLCGEVFQDKTYKNIREKIVGQNLAKHTLKLKGTEEREVFVNWRSQSFLQRIDLAYLEKEKKLELFHTIFIDDKCEPDLFYTNNEGKIIGEYFHSTYTA